MSEQKIKEVYVAIVTLPNKEKIEIGDKTFKRFKSTYVEHKQFLTDKEVIQSYYEDAGKSVAFNRIHQIAIGFEYDNTIRVSVLNGKEKNIIEEFHNLLKVEQFKSAKLYGYNNSFIYDSLVFRARVNKISSEFEAPQFKDIQNKEWSRKLSICLMDKVVTSFRGKISLLNTLYGAELPDDNIISGEDIFTFYKNGELEKIDLSSANIIKGLVNINRFLQTKEPIEELVFNSKKMEQKEREPINVLEHILSSGELSSKIIEKIVEFTEENKLDKENVLTLVKTALSNNKEYQKVLEEDYIELKESLGLCVDYSKIQVVVDKKNLGKKEADALIVTYEKSKKKEKQEIISLVEQYLIEKNKIGQKRAKEAFEYLKEKLN